MIHFDPKKKKNKDPSKKRRVVAAKSYQQKLEEREQWWERLKKKLGSRVQEEDEVKKTTMTTTKYQGQGFHNDVAYCDNYHQGSLDLGAMVLVQQQHLHVLNKNQRIPPCLLLPGARTYSTVF